MEVGELQIWGQAGLHSCFQASLGYRARTSLKTFAHGNMDRQDIFVYGLNNNDI
jgi:hypothetical protein